jgi:hypothetical protein
VEATCLIGLLIAALLLDRQATDDATVVWASGRVGSADVHEPFTTSPTPDRGPGTTVPDAEAYARLGLPPPLTIAGAPVDRPAGSGPGIDEPYTTGPATTTGPQSTVATLQQRIDVDVDRTDVGPPPATTPTTGGPGPSTEVAAEGTGRSPSSGALPRTGAVVTGLVLLAALLIGGGLALRALARRRADGRAEEVGAPASSPDSSGRG